MQTVIVVDVACITLCLLVCVGSVSVSLTRWQIAAMYGRSITFNSPALHCDDDDICLNANIFCFSRLCA